MAESYEGFEFNRELIAQKFWDCMVRTERPGYEPSGPHATSTVYVDTNPDLKKASLHRLESSILPRLRWLITTLSTAVKRCYLQEELPSSFRLIRHCQEELDQLLNQYSEDVDKLHPGEVQIDDRHLEILKSYRSIGLYKLLCNHVGYSIGIFCQCCRGLMQRLTEESNTQDMASDVDSVDQHANNYYPLNDETDTVCGNIDSALRWITSTELDIVQDHWRGQRHRINRTVADLSKLIDPPTIPDPLSLQPKSEALPLGEPIRTVAISLAPILKLVRLFFQKLSLSGMKIKQQPLFTTMSFDELCRIEALPRNIETELKVIMGALQPADTAHPSTCQLLNHTIERLESHFNKVYVLMRFHCFPILPDNSPTCRTYFEDWLITWKSLFSLALLNFWPSIFELEMRLSLRV